MMKIHIDQGGDQNGADTGNLKKPTLIEAELAMSGISLILGNYEK